MLVSNSLLFGTSNSMTAALSRPSVARVCVEVDLLKDLPSRIWVQLGKGHGFWQPLNPENLPKYCCQCYHQSHEEEDCHFKNLELQPKLVSQVEAKPIMEF